MRICPRPHCFLESSDLVTMNMSKTDYRDNTVEWNQLNWRKIQKAVFKLQKRIYQAHVNGDVKKGRRLQKTLVKSYYNRLLSVRKVSQDNQGKKRMRPRVAERRKGTRTKQVWSKVGHRPEAIVQYRYEWLYVYGFVKPKLEKLYGI